MITICRPEPLAGTRRISGVLADIRRCPLYAPGHVGEGPEPMISSFGAFIFVPGFISTSHRLFGGATSFGKLKSKGIIRHRATWLALAVWRSLSAPR